MQQSGRRAAKIGAPIFKEFIILLVLEDNNMYTLSIRPATNPGRRSFNTCMNFTQASMSWEQSTFSEDSRDAK